MFASVPQINARFGYSVDATDAVHAMEGNIARLVETDQRLGEFSIDVQPVPHGLGTIVLSLVNRLPALVTHISVGRRGVINVEHVSVGAYPAARDPPDDLLRINHYHHRSVESGPAEAILERLSLGDCARKAIEYESIPRIRSAYPLQEHCDHQVIGYEVTTLHDGSGLQSEIGSFGDSLTEHVACGDVRNLQIRSYPLRLGPFTGPRGP